MIIIADSGSTKTDWCAVAHGEVIKKLSTKGMNPFFQTEAEMTHEIKTALLPQLPDMQPDEIHFYGSGCAFPDKVEMVESALASCFGVENGIAVNTDMLAAARSLCGHNAGIACIIGTGSNSCHYDGERIVGNVSPLGFILGDEGSGAYLGKRLVGDLLKNQLPANLKAAFMEQFQLTPADIIDRVYRQPFPNRFLAGLSPFLLQHLDVPSIHRLVLEGFQAFLKRNVMQYAYQQHQVGFVGSIAFYYKDVLAEAMDDLHLRMGKIAKTPMDGLIDYHCTP